MAKLEIPSIVVHSGSPSVPGVSMDRPARQTPQLRKQKSSLDDGDSGSSGCIHHSKLDASGLPLNSTNNNNNSNNNNNQQSSSKAGETGGGSKSSSPGGSNSKCDVDKPCGPQPQLSRSRSNGKMKMLTRSHAMREATSPPPDPSAVQQALAASTNAATTSTSTNTQATPSAVSNNGKNNSQASKTTSNNNGSSNHHTGSNNSNGNGNNNNNNHNSHNNNNKTKNGNNKNKDQNNTSSNRNNHRQNKNIVYISSPQETWGGLLSRDSLDQFVDPAKADLDGFIAQQMSTKNRALLLRVEEELVKLLDDPRAVYFRFPQMTSFHRMLVHRAATYFGMDHNLDSSGTCVVVNRNRNSRKPEKSFSDIQKVFKGLHNRAYSTEEPRKSILKRDFASFEDSQYKSDEKQLSLESRRSKSFEEREEEYERARRRIFSRDVSTHFKRKWEE